MSSFSISVATERELFEVIASFMEAHLLPSVVIGSSFAQLCHKYHAVVHALWLETGRLLCCLDSATPSSGSLVTRGQNLG